MRLVIKSATNERNENNNSTTIIRNSNSEEVTDPYHVTNEFNKNLIEIGIKMSNNIQIFKTY